MKSLSCVQLFFNPMDCSHQAPHFMDGILQARLLQWVAVPFSRGSSWPRDWTWVSGIAGNLLPSEPPGKAKNTGMGSFSLPQQIFLTQESNWGLLPCRQILYQLSFQGISSIIKEGKLCCFMTLYYSRYFECLLLIFTNINNLCLANLLLLLLLLSHFSRVWLCVTP